MQLSNCLNPEVAPVGVREQVSLAPLTTLRIGGPARFFAEVSNQAELREAVDFARVHGLPIFCLGGGSNLLVSDAGFDGLVLHIALTAPIVRVANDFEVAAGTDWDAFVREVCEQGISGVECLAGIPGLVGGSPVQNIGAYGQEVSQTIYQVAALDLESMEMVVLDREACGFAYRSSIFNTTCRNRYVVTGVTFRFDPAARPNLSYKDLQRYFEGLPEPTPLNVYCAVREIRGAKGMLLVEDDPDSRSAGSFFKNPIVSRGCFTRVCEVLALEEGSVPHWDVGADYVKLPAAWLLERAGFHKGFAMGAAGISSRHTLALINRGGASFAEMVALRDVIVRGVGDRFGILLEQEPVQLGS